MSDSILSELYDQMKLDLYVGKADEIASATQKALEMGQTPAQILNCGLVAGMQVVGRDFRDGILFVPEVLYAAKAMKAGMEILKPLLTQTGAKRIGTFVVGTVKGDVHDIGKNLIAMMMEGAGFAVTDLGTNTPPEKFVQAVRDLEPDLLGMSALLTTTMPMMKVTVEALKGAGLRDKVKVVVGGAPVTEAWAKAIGADGYGRDAGTVVEEAKRLIGKEQV